MSDEDFKKQVLEQFGVMNKQFAAIDKRFDTIEKRFEAIDKRFDKMDERFDKLETGLAEVQRDVGLVYDALQTVLVQQEDEAKERAHMLLVLDRHERWITGLAKRADLKLSYD